MTDPASGRLALAFLERFWSDRDTGRSVGLPQYLDQFPGHDELIAREYLAATSEARGDEKTGEWPPSEEGRIGPYRLLEELGRGGQGVVWLAEDTRLGRRVALKVLTGLGPGAETHLARFRREASLASKLDHPGICGVHDTGIEGGVPYIAMRYVEGETLADRLSRLKSEGVAPGTSSVITFDDGDGEAGSKAAPERGVSSTASVDKKELDRVVAAFEKVARALHAAHEVGIVHRDIKPGNVMITAEGEPVLLDFGLAQDDSDGSGPSLTQTGDLFGTPAYMSPEQITGRRVRIDRRSDVYSLGVTLYECLTLKRPFDAPTRESLYQAILSKEPDRARKHNRQIPPDLEVVVQCAMSKDRDKRYQTAGDLAEDLRRVRAGEPILAKKVSPLGRAWRWSKRRPAAAALVCALALGIPAISGLGVWYWTHRDDVEAQERARRDEVVEDALEAGFYELHEGKVERALPAFERALSADAGSAEAVVGLALAHKKRKAADALEAALRAITEGERSVADPKVLGRTKADILTRLGRKAEAAVAMESAPKIEGPLMWFLEGTRAIDAGHRLSGRRAQAAFQGAVEHLTRAVAASPRARRAYHFQLAHALGHGDPGDAKAAAAVADALAGLWPASASAWFWGGFLLNHLDPGRALAAYREGLRIDPGDHQLRNGYGLALQRQDKLEEAVAEFREAIRLDRGSPNVHYNLGVTLRRQGKLDEAVAEYRTVIRLDPGQAIAHQSLGNVLAQQGKFEEAVAEHREALRLDEDYEEARISLGFALDGQGKVDEALAEYLEATRRNPDSATPHYDRALILERRKKIDEAIAEHRNAIRLEPTHARAREQLGKLLVGQGKVDEAIAEFREAIRLDPGFVDAHHDLGTAFAEQRKTDEAIAEYREAIRLDPKYASSHNGLGVVLSRQKKLKEAIAEYREAIRLEPGLALAHFNLANAHMEEGKPDEAIAGYREAIRLDPKDAEAHAALGTVLEEHGRPEDAIAEFREATRLGPGHVRAHKLLGVALARQGRLDEAIAPLREAVRLAPTDAEAHSNLGTAFSDQGKPEEAAASIREAIRLDPGNAMAHNTLGIVFARQGRLDEAIPAFREAARLAPGNPGLQANLRQALLEAGKSIEADAESKPANQEPKK